MVFDAPHSQKLNINPTVLPSLARRPDSGLFFNALFNLHKFLAYENRDPFAMRAEALAAQEGVAPPTEWDKFARAEYVRLAQEEDADGGMQVDGGGGNSWM